MPLLTIRFAPSPTGYLHLGHGFSALTAWQAAQACDGRFILRIENIDTTRCRPHFEQAILDDLQWLGLEWEQPVRRQDQHLQDYEQALSGLIDRGLVYRCFKTRKEIAAAILSAPHTPLTGPEGPIFTSASLPPKEEAERLERQEPFAWRLSMMACRTELGALWGELSFTEKGCGPNGETGKIIATPEIFGDAIIARKDIGTSYHLCVIHDDGLQSISHVIRGQDLYFATHLHVLLQVLLGLPTPIYHHHKLLKDDTGERLAKRKSSTSLKDMREAGMSRAEVIEMIGR